MAITAEILRAIMPRVPDAAQWADVLSTAMTRFEVTTPAREAAFLAQVAHESNECRHLVENLSYSAKRLTQVWPKRFPTIESAEPYAGQPEKLANKVYAYRIGNGSPASGDGWRYRGRGLMQITGRSNYRACGRGIGIDLEAAPEQLEDPLIAAYAAAQFWQSIGANALADVDGDEDEDFETISVRINGGRVGLGARKEYWARAKSVLGIVTG